MHLTVASYNIHRGTGLDRRLDLERIARVILEITPDVIGLQEVVRGTGSDHADQAGYLAVRLGMQLVMGITRADSDGAHGNAVLTRLPVLGSAGFDLSRGRREPRGGLRVDVNANGRLVHVFNCHFGLGVRERTEQIDLLLRVLRGSTELGGPRMLMGDFNEWHRGPVTRRLRREFASPVPGMRRTHPALFPLFRLDRIYWDAELGADAFRVHGSRLARVASDHLPVVARLRVGPPVGSGSSLPRRSAPRRSQAGPV